jgi:hypothetical protein
MGADTVRYWSAIRNAFTEQDARARNGSAIVERDNSCQLERASDSGQGHRSELTKASVVHLNHASVCSGGCPRVERRRINDLWVHSTNEIHGNDVAPRRHAGKFEMAARVGIGLKGVKEPRWSRRCRPPSRPRARLRLVRQWKS